MTTKTRITLHFATAAFWLAGALLWTAQEQLALGCLEHWARGSVCGVGGQSVTQE